MEWEELKVLKWHAVDLDGCLADTSLDKLDLDQAKPKEPMLRIVRSLDKAGYKIVIHTARHWGDYIKIEQWLNKWDIPYRDIVCGKLLAGWYWDDRAKNPFCGECKDKSDRVIKGKKRTPD